MPVDFLWSAEVIEQKLLNSESLLHVSKMSDDVICHHFMRVAANKRLSNFSHEDLERLWEEYVQLHPELSQEQIERLRSMTTSSVMGKMLSDSKGQAYFITDADIVSVFFERIRNNNANKKLEQINTLWKSYVSKLPKYLKDKASKLTGVVSYTPRSLPKSFTFREAMKAMLLISIPDRLYLRDLDDYVPRGARDDMMMGRIAVTTSRYNGQVTFTPDANIKHEAFENLIRDRELKHLSSKFLPFMQFAQTTTVFDKYTVGGCAKLFIDTFKEDFLALLADSEIRIALTAAKISPVKMLEVLSQRYVYYMESFVLAKLPDGSPIGRSFHEIVSNTLMAIGDDFNRIANPNWSPKQLIEEYVKFVNFDIRLQVAPALNPHGRERQKFVYRKAAMIRDTERHDQMDIIRETRAYSPDLSTKDILPQDHSLKVENSAAELQNAMVHGNLHEATEADEEKTVSIHAIKAVADSFSMEGTEDTILRFFFESNIAFIRQFDSKKCGSDVSTIILLDLWDTFVSAYPLEINTKVSPLRKKITAQNAQFLAILEREKMADHTLMQNLNEAHTSQTLASKETLNSTNAVFIAWMYPNILERIGISLDKIQEFETLIAESNVTRLRIATDWMLKENCYHQILSYFNDSASKLETTLLPINRSRVLRILLPLYSTQTLSTLENDVTAIFILKDKVPEQLFISIVADLWREWAEKETLLPHVTATFSSDKALFFKVIDHIALYSDDNTLTNILTTLIRAAYQSSDNAMLIEMMRWVENKKETSEANTQRRASYVFAWAIALYEAASRNELKKARDLVKTLPKAIPAHAEANYEHRLTTALDNRATGNESPLPRYFDHPRIQTFLLDQLNGILDFEGKDILLSILENSFPLHEKLKLLSAIAEGLLSNSSAKKRRYLNPQAHTFCMGLVKFSSVTTDCYIQQAWNDFLKETHKIKEDVIDIESEIQCCVLFREEIVIASNLIEQSSATHQKNLTKIKQPLPEVGNAIFKTIEETQTALQSIEKSVSQLTLLTSKIEVSQSSETPDEHNTDITFSQDEIFEREFKRWVEFSIANKQQINISNLPFAGALRVSKETINTCFQYIKDKIPSLLVTLASASLGILEESPTTTSASMIGKRSPLLDALHVACINGLRDGEDFWEVLTNRPQQEVDVSHREINETSHAIHISSLLNQYSNLSNGYKKSEIALEISQLCNEKQLQSLGETLGAYQDIAHTTFFSCAPRGMQKVITMINKNEPAVKILLKLQEVAKDRGAGHYHIRRDKKTSQAYDLINAFFEPTQEQKIDRLIDDIKKNHSIAPSLHNPLNNNG